MMRAIGSLLTSFIIAGVYASNVLDLTPDNFDQHIKAGTPALVEFFAPWCGHCKNLAPVYEELADSFAKSKNKVIVAKVDADGEGRPLGEKYGITGFPTLKWFDGSDAEPEAYEMDRDLESFQTFITEKTGVKAKPKPPPVTLQLDVHNFKEVVMDTSKDVLVAFTASWCGHCKQMKPELEKASTTFLPESNCVIANFEADNTKNLPIAREYEITSYPTFKFFSKDNKTPLPYEGNRVEKDFVRFLNEKCGTHRAAGGGLDDTAGRIANLDAIATKFYAAVGDARSSIYREAEAVADAAGVYGQQYLKVMEKVVNGSEGYLAKESQRLKNILDKRTLSPSKLDEIKIKANIIAAFTEEKAEDVKEAVEEGAKKIKEEL